MKKQFIKIYVPLILMGILAGTNSCTSELDQMPPTQKQLSNFLNNESEAVEYVNATYSILRSLYNWFIVGMAELPSDNLWVEVPANGNGSCGDLDLFRVAPTNSWTCSTWQNSYVAIQAANTVLNRIDNIPFSDDTKKMNIKGEMYFLRGLHYFNLVRIFGGVPLVTQETQDPFDYFGQGRQSADEIYAQIIDDLNKAKEMAPSIASRFGQATKYAAHTLLGKVHLTLHAYDKARSELLEVKNSGNYSVLPVDKIFGVENENNAEVIFNVQFASGINGNSMGSGMHQDFSPIGTVSGAAGFCLPTRELLNLYAPGDLRRDQWLALTDDGVPYSLKLTPSTGPPGDGPSDFIILRYSDVILMLAEIENQLDNQGDINTDGTALYYLNMIRSRSGVPAVTTTDKEQLAEAIATERRFELVTEGHRWWDLIRTGKAVETMNAWFKDQNINLTVLERQLLMPIPQSQVDTDPSLVQNP